MMENVRAFMLTFELQDYCEFLAFYPEDIEKNTGTAEYIKNMDFIYNLLLKMIKT